jgi:hypothetical protein
MADKSNINMSQIKKLEKNVQDNLGTLYTDVRFANPATANTIDFMRNKMHRSIDKLMSNNVSNAGMSNISHLYLRSKNMQNDKSIIDGIANTFENEAIMNNVMSIYSQNSHLRDLDKEIEVICKYMPKLVDAMDTRKEHVLSADHFSKDSINIKNGSTTDSDISSASNIKEMKEKYDIDELMSNIYKEADYKGECFVYIVPYKKAIKRLLDNDSNNNVIANESYNYTYTREKGMAFKQVTGSDISNKGFTIELDKRGVVESFIKAHQQAETFIAENGNLALSESGRIVRKSNSDNITEERKEVKPLNSGLIKLDKTLNKDIKEKFYSLDPTASDGFIATDKAKDTELNIPGCVVKILDHTMVKPLYIEDVCLGYFYIECDKTMDLEQTTFSSTLGGITPGKNFKNEFDQDEDSVILKKIAKEMSNNIDKKFVNANQDLSKEIYLILKYNQDVGVDGKINKIKVSFIPPEDMVHAYFEKDPKTHRGISGLMRALFPAKLFACLYISNTIAILTRGQDKRVYYVKQSVDTNIAGVLLNTISQIKKSNFGLRQIENMNNMLNITGRFNDIIIPRSPSGDSPVEFEVMQGQNVEIKTELMNMLEEMAVNSTDVPLEVIQARQQLDYATHYTMSNTKFLRKVYNRQSKFKKISDRVLTKVYNAEFDCEDSIDTTLPPPMYLNLMNTGQIFQSTNEMAQNTTEMYAGDEEPDVQQLFTREVKKYYLSSFLPTDELDRMLDRAKMKAKVNPKQIQ